MSYIRALAQVNCLARQKYTDVTRAVNRFFVPFSSYATLVLFVNSLREEYVNI
jgi:hypothetical protein